MFRVYYMIWTHQPFWPTRCRNTILVLEHILAYICTDNCAKGKSCMIIIVVLVPCPAHEMHTPFTTESLFRLFCSALSYDDDDRGFNNIFCATQRFCRPNIAKSHMLFFGPIRPRWSYDARSGFVYDSRRDRLRCAALCACHAIFGWAIVSGLELSVWFGGVGGGGGIVECERSCGAITNAARWPWIVSLIDHNRAWCWLWLRLDGCTYIAFKIPTRQTFLLLFTNCHFLWTA